MSSSSDLVSVVVVTFNSDPVIAETIKSIYEQTYENIELIIQDDHSSDNTMETARKWCEDHKADERFVRISISSNDENLGTSRNLNEGCRHATGRWIKEMGGDDLLTRDCIEKNVSFVTRLNEDVLVISDVIGFYENASGKRVEQPFYSNIKGPYFRKFNRRNAKQQYRMVLHEYCIDSPTFFYSRRSLENIGGYDTRYFLMEDWPFVVKWTKNGRCIRYMEEPTVYYRMGDPDTVKGTTFFNLEHEKRIQRFKEDEIYPNISRLDILYWVGEWVMRFDRFVMVRLFRNRMTRFSMIVDYVITWFVPYRWGSKVANLRRLGINGLAGMTKWYLRKAE